MLDFIYNPVLDHVLLVIAETLAVLVPVLIMMAYATYWERKALGAFQLRKGPNRVGPFGLLQPFADAVKLVMKETIIPSGANRVLFLMAPAIAFVLACMAWAVIPPFDGGAVADINVGILYLFAISRSASMALSSRAGRAIRNTRFWARCGRRRRWSATRFRSGSCSSRVLLCAGSLNLNQIVQAQAHVWFFIPLFPMFIVFLISDAGGNQPGAVRFAGRRKRARGRVLRGIQRHDVRAVLSSANTPT